MPEKDPALEHVGDIPLVLEARVSCNPLTVEELLLLQEGSVLRTGRAAGDTVEISIGLQPMGEGEVIVIGNSLAVRMSDLGEKN